MEFDDWLLALHVLSAFALVGATTMFTIGLLALRRTDLPARIAAIAPVMRVGQVVVMIGIVGTIVFGVWLSFSIDRYDIWDAWIIIAIILWAIGTETGRRIGVALAPPFQRAADLVGQGKTEPDPELGAQLHSRDAVLMHTISTLAVLLVLVDMIWKPGA